jgi:hypothetical protein
LQSVSGLLQDGNGQVLIGSQRQVVAMVADLSMGTPGASGSGPLMMSSEVARLADKTKRGLLCDPGKPLWGIRLKREHAMLGTDHDVASLFGELDARDDMDRFGRRFGGGRGWRPKRTFGRLGRRKRRWWAGRRRKVRWEEGSEPVNRSLQRADLRL